MAAEVLAVFCLRDHWYGNGLTFYPVTLVTVFQVLTCALYVFPAYFLYRYADAIVLYLHGQKKTDLETAFGFQGSFWKFIGILMAVMMAFAVVGIISAFMIPLLAT